MHAYFIKRIYISKKFWLQAKIISSLSKKANNPTRTLCTKFCHPKWKISVPFSVKPNFGNGRASPRANTPPTLPHPCICQHTHPHPRYTSTCAHAQTHKNTFHGYIWESQLHITHHTLTLECQIHNTANSHTSSWCCMQFIPCCVWIYSNTTTGQTNKALNGKLWQLVHV